MTDPIADILATFVEATQRLMSSPVDYHQAERWIEDGIPANIAQAVILQALADQPLRKKQGFQLQWLDPQVREAHDSWRRAIGPWSTVQ